MAAVRMNITLPAKTAKKLEKVAKPRERSKFIADAIEKALHAETMEALMKRMIEDYRSIEIDDETKEWLDADLGELNED